MTETFRPIRARVSFETFLDFTNRIKEKSLTQSVYVHYDGDMYYGDIEFGKIAGHMNEFKEVCLLWNECMDEE